MSPRAAPAHDCAGARDQGPSMKTLERFHNSCIRVARVERRFSAAFAAAKCPAQAAEVVDLSGLSDFLFLPYTRAPRARTTRTGGYTNPGTALVCWGCCAGHGDVART